MLKWIRRWYNDTPQQVRYAWIFTLACFVGIPRFVWMIWHGSDLWNAIFWGLILYTFDAGIIASLPMMVADLRTEKFTVWPQLDEMQKQINTKARAATAIVFYLYFSTAVLTIMWVADSKGMEMIPVDALEHMLYLGVFVWLISLAVSTVVIYNRQNTKVDEVESSTAGEAEQ